MKIPSGFMKTQLGESYPVDVSSDQSQLSGNSFLTVTSAVALAVVDDESLSDTGFKMPPMALCAEEASKPSNALNPPPLNPLAAIGNIRPHSGNGWTISRKNISSHNNGYISL